MAPVLSIRGRVSPPPPPPPPPPTRARDSTFWGISGNNVRPTSLHYLGVRLKWCARSRFVGSARRLSCAPVSVCAYPQVPINLGALVVRGCTALSQRLKRRCGSAHLFRFRAHASLPEGFFRLWARRHASSRDDALLSAGVRAEAILETCVALACKLGAIVFARSYGGHCLWCVVAPASPRLHFCRPPHFRYASLVDRLRASCGLKLTIGAGTSLQQLELMAACVRA